MSAVTNAIDFVLDHLAEIFVALIIVVGVPLMVVGVRANIAETKAWEADCVARGGTVNKVTKHSTGTGIGADGKPVTTTSSTTTRYCLTDDGRLIGIR